MADLALLFTACLWGINIPIVKQVTTQLDAWVFNGLRLILAMLTLGACVWLESRFQRSTVERVSWMKVVVFALISSLVYQLIFILGITRTTAGNTALIMASMPMWTAALSFFFVRERLQAVTWVGLLVTFSGTAIVTLQGGKISLSSEFFLGNLCMLMAAIAWAGGTVYSRPLLATLSPLRLAFWSSLMTLPFHLWLASGKLSSSWEIVCQTGPLVAIVFSGIFSTGLAYAAWHYGVSQLGASHAAVYQNAVTLVAVLGGWIWVGEQPLLTQIIGGGLIIAGLFLMRRGRL